MKDKLYTVKVRVTADLYYFAAAASPEEAEKIGLDAAANQELPFVFKIRSWRKNEVLEGVRWGDVDKS